MPDGGASAILIAAALGAAGSAATAGAVAGATVASIAGAALAGAAIGAATAGLQLALAPHKPHSTRETTDKLQTTQQHNIVVPVVFGRARVAGNYLAIGNFHYWGTKAKDNGGQVYLVHCVIGLCEGEIRAAGNYRVNDKAVEDYKSELRDKRTYPDGLDESAWFLLKSYAGKKTETPLPMMLNTDPDVNPGGEAAENGFIDEDGLNVGSGTVVVPWRDTALVACQLYTGYDVGLPSISADIVGPSFAQRVASTSITGSNFGDVPRYVCYDGYTQSFWWTLASSSGTEGTHGIVREHRAGDFGHQHTQPPLTVTSPTEFGWYLGRHDIVVMQDPTDNRLFHIGYWGISPGSEDWESTRPHEGYGKPILAQHLDELHGVLHTIHYDEESDRVYIMRWWLLTGRIEQTYTDVAGTTSFYAICYSADIDAYAVAADNATIYLISPRTGKVFNSTTELPLGGCKGIFVSGPRVGVVKAGGVRFWDTGDGETTGNYGSGGTDLLPGHFGGIWSAFQNTWTGHVTLAKPSGGDTACINFLPSVRESEDDISANGSTDQPEFQDFSALENDIDSWVRDWSWRKYNEYDLKRLQGNSSLAGAAWAMITDVADSKRWGAGLPSDLFDISSFEALHARCVSGWRYRYRVAKDNLSPDYYWAEKFKFDYLLDSTASASAMLSQEMLAACNGYRYMMGGRLHVGLVLPGFLSAWHFTHRDIGADSVSVNFLGRTGMLNRVRVEYIEARRDYRGDFAEANDEFDQARTGRIADQTLTISGIARPGQAEMVARTILDQGIGSRRQVEWKSHYLAYVLTASDPVEMTYDPCALNRTQMRIVQMEESEDQSIKLTALEHKPMLEMVREAGPVQTPVPVVTPPPLDPSDCGTVLVRGDGVIVWFNEGAAYAPGTYYSSIISGGVGTEYEAVTRDAAGAIVVLGSADGVLVLTEAGPIGYRSTSGVGTAIIQLCLSLSSPIIIDSASGSPSSGPSSSSSSSSTDSAVCDLAGSWKFYQDTGDDDIGTIHISADASWTSEGTDFVFPGNTSGTIVVAHDDPAHPVITPDGDKDSSVEHQRYNVEFVSEPVDDGEGGTSTSSEVFTLITGGGTADCNRMDHAFGYHLCRGEGCP